MNVLSKIKKSVFLLLVNTVLKGTRFFECKRLLLNCCKGVCVGAGTKVVAPVQVPCQSELHIGENCWIGRDLTIEGNGCVQIGDDCDIAPNVVFTTGSHLIAKEGRRAGKGFNGTISIGSGSWIGTRALILPNVVIGRGCVVGAGSIVPKNLDADGCYAGNPARKIRSLNEE